MTERKNHAYKFLRLIQIRCVQALADYRRCLRLVLCIFKRGAGESLLLARSASAAAIFGAELRDKQTE